MISKPFIQVTDGSDRLNHLPEVKRDLGIPGRLERDTLKDNVDGEKAR